jgi:hypothetical protein
MFSAYLGEGATWPLPCVLIPSPRRKNKKHMKNIWYFLIMPARSNRPKNGGINFDVVVVVVKT